MVIGAGTLGNEVCKNLALLGIGKITIIDNDIVEQVNLSRSVLMREKDIGCNKADVLADRMKDLYSGSNVTPLNFDVVYQYGSANYRDFDLVLMTVDNLEARIYINRYCNMWGVPLINGGLEGLVCEVQVMQPPHTACFECALSSHDYAEIRKRYSCDGLKRSAPEGKIPMVITSAAIGGGLMAQEAVKLLHGSSSSLGGKRVIIDGNVNDFAVLSVARNANCIGHYNVEINNSIELDYSVDMLLGSFKYQIKDILDSEFVVYHDKSILYGGICPSCRVKKELLGPAGMTSEGELFCENCRTFLVPIVYGELKRDDRTLRAHGVPENHVLTIGFPDGQFKYIVPRT